MDKTRPKWVVLMKMNSLKSWIAMEIFCFCDYFHIPMGRFGPYLFGVMIGQSGKRIK
jgi:hypothetical protein